MATLEVLALGKFSIKNTNITKCEWLGIIYNIVCTISPCNFKL